MLKFIKISYEVYITDGVCPTVGFHHLHYKTTVTTKRKQRSKRIEC